MFLKGNKELKVKRKQLFVLVTSVVNDKMTLDFGVHVELYEGRDGQRLSGKVWMWQHHTQG